MRNFIIKSFEYVLIITFLVIVGWFTIAGAGIGIIPGIIIGACVTGFGFILLSINENLTEIKKTLTSTDVT